MIPPRPIRRLVLTPLPIVAAIVAGALSALLVPIGFLVSRGRRRVPRIAVVALAWPVLETAVLAAAFWLWISRRGSPERHYTLCAWFLSRLYSVGSRAAGLVVEIQEPPNAATDRPLVVLSRHAGPGDSFLIVHYLLNVCGRRPRIVMKEQLRLDPAIDVVLGRLPNTFVPGRGTPRERTVAEIGRLAAGLGPRDAMLIFPEGGNFTPRRRVRAIRRLHRHGRRAEAERARQLENVLPPQPTGTLTAIEAATAADVIFVAHTGADELTSLRDVWRALPMNRPLRARWWRVPYEEIPATGRERWLYDWWETVDAWITDNRLEEAG